MSEANDNEPLIAAEDLHYGANYTGTYGLSLSEVKERVKKDFTGHYAEYMQKLDPEVFGRMLTERLAHEQEAVILRLMGLKKDFGRWEVAKDHAPVADEIVQGARPIIAAWVEKNIARMLEEEMPKAVGEVKKAIRAAVREKISWEIRQVGTHYAERILKTAKQEVEDEIFKEKKE